MSASPTIPVVGVVGLGAVGEPLLHLLRGAGYDVVGIDSDPEVLERVEKHLNAAAELSRAPGPGAEAGADPTLGTDPELLARADLVIEATPEDLPAKAGLLRRIGDLCPAHTVLVTTTTAISLTTLAGASGRPDLTLGLRLLVPPAVGGRVEPFATAFTSPAAVDALRELLDTLGLEPAAIGTRAGADATAVVFAYLNRAVAMLDLGYATRDAIDTAMRLGCRLPAGPLELLDHIGLDAAVRTLSQLEQRTGDSVFRPSPLLERLVRDGRTGRKSRAGFYAYDDLGAVSDDASDVPDVAGGDGGAGIEGRVRRVGVVGSGVMARGIAEVTVAAGLPTVLVARSREKARLALESVGTSLDKSVRRGRIRPEAAAEALGRLEGREDFSALSDCDLVIEAVAEDLAIKRAVFAELGRICRPGAVLATTTSSMPVGACAESSGRPGDVVGMHFFNPAPAMKLIELVRTSETCDSAASAARAFCGVLGKTAVACADRTGFIVNYLLFPYLGDAIRLLDRHDVDIEELDAAVESGFGYPMGPFALLDTIGLDVSLAITDRLHTAFAAPDFDPPVLLRQLVAHGSLGRKTGQGFRSTRRTSNAG